MTQIEKFQQAEEILSKYEIIVPIIEKCYCPACHGLIAGKKMRIGVFGALYFATYPDIEEEYKALYKNNNTLGIERRNFSTLKDIRSWIGYFKLGVRDTDFTGTATCRKFMNKYNSMKQSPDLASMMQTVGHAMALAKPKMTMTQQFKQMNRWLKM